MPSTTTKNGAASFRTNHVITIAPASSDGGSDDDGLARRSDVHALEIRVVKLEQLVKFGGMVFALLQLSVTIYLGLRGG